MRPRRSPRDDERGSVTVIAAAIVAACVIVAVALAAIAAVQGARGRAQAAADLAALAAANAWVNSTGEPCAVAAVVVAGNGAELSDCSLAGSDVIVGARVPVAGPLESLGLVASASARAGPE